MALRIDKLTTAAKETMDKISLKDRIQIARCPLDWAQWVAREYHYKKCEVHALANPFAYRVSFDGKTSRPDGLPCGMIMFASVHFTRQRELFGYGHIQLKNCKSHLTGSCNPDEAEDILEQLGLWVGDQKNWQLKYDFIDKWQVLILSRLWLHDDLPRNSETIVISKALKLVQRDWLEHHPPRLPDNPYHIRLVISYSDKNAKHTGIIYRAANFEEVKEASSQTRHRHGDKEQETGKDNLTQFAYRLKEPRWKFEQGRLW